MSRTTALSAADGHAQDVAGSLTQPAAPPRPAVPGTVTACAAITVMTILVAWFAGDPATDPLLRPLYFAVLWGFFHWLGRRQPEIRVLPFLLVQGGFAVLTLGYVLAAATRWLASEQPWVESVWVATLERGAVFLLGLSMVSYGIVLWIPELLAGQQLLRERYDRTKGRLQRSEHARARIEQRLEQTQRVHAIAELSAGLAHDLRNPLAIIKAAAQALHTSHGRDGDIADHLSVMQRNVDRAERTIAGLLEVGQPRSGEAGRLDLAATLSELAALVAPEARRRGVAVDASGNPPLVVETDRKRLLQALVNLLMNALQASAEGGAVALRCRPFRLGGAALAAVSIEDRGTGIDENTRQKLFQPFFTTKREGSGLGLLSTRRGIEELGGRVGLFPRACGGARALLLLPAQLEPAPAPRHRSLACANLPS